jgi:hypothetical protein
MFNLEEMMKANARYEKVNVAPFGDLKIKLITQDELKDVIKQGDASLIYEFVCDVDCEKAFSSVEDIKKNMLIVDKDNLFASFAKVNHIGAKQSDIEEK